MNPHWAGFWVRTIADTIDSLILDFAALLLELIMLGLFYGIAVVFHTHPGGLPPFWTTFDSLWMQIAFVALRLCLSFPYYVIGHYKWSTTIGKRALGIYVVNRTNLGPIDMKQSVVRFISYLASYAFFCVGFLMAGFHPEKRGLHDLIAGTACIRKERS